MHSYKLFLKTLLLLLAFTILVSCSANKLKDRHIKIGVISPHVKLNVYELKYDYQGGTSLVNPFVATMPASLLTSREKAALDDMLNFTIEEVTKPYDCEIIKISEEILDSLGLSKRIYQGPNFLEQLPITSGKTVNVVDYRDYEQEDLSNYSLYHVSKKPALTIQHLKLAHKRNAEVEVSELSNDLDIDRFIKDMDYQNSQLSEYVDVVSFQYGFDENKFLPEGYTYLTEKNVERLTRTISKKLDLDAVLLISNDFEVYTEKTLLSANQKYQGKMKSSVVLKSNSGRWLFKKIKTNSTIAKKNRKNSKVPNIDCLMIDKGDSVTVIRYPMNAFNYFSLTNKYEGMYKDLFNQFKSFFFKKKK